MLRRALKVLYPEFFLGITEMGVQISMETNFDDRGKRTHQLGRLSRPCQLTQKEGLDLLLGVAGGLPQTLLIDALGAVDGQLILISRLLVGKR